jgi:hypothetical protein
MGSFNMVCNISGLSIVPGDKVRILFLSKGPYSMDPLGSESAIGAQYNSREGSSVDNYWHPWAAPLKAVYDDYGNVSDVEDSLTSTLFWSQLRKYLYKTEAGENPYHDVSTNVKMSWDEMWQAARAGRLRVQMSEEYTDKGRHKGIPLVPVLILESVWEACLKLDFTDNWSKDDRESLQDIVEDMKKELAKPRQSLSTSYFQPGYDFLGRYCIRDTPGISGAAGLFYFFCKSVQHFKTTKGFEPFSDEEVDGTTRSFAELCKLHMTMMDLSRPWRIGILGGQDPNYQHRAHFHALLSELAYRAADRLKEEYERAGMKVARLDPETILGK